MIRPSRWWQQSGWLALAGCVPAVALVWLGYRAVVEWEHAAATVAWKRAQSAVELLVAALSRDMRGAQFLVLSAADRDSFTIETELDLLDPVGTGLGRYPYAEAFFSWRGAANPASVVFYSRSEQRPPWLITQDGAPKTLPLMLTPQPEVARRLIERVTRDSHLGRRFSVFNMELAGTPHQVVAAISFSGSRQQQPAAVLGFVVDLNWVRQRYFGSLVTQVSRIESQDHDLTFAVFDERDRVVDGRPVSDLGAPMERRPFPLAFFDPLVVAVDPPADLDVAWWTAVVDASNDATLAAASRGARRTMAVAVAMAVVLGAGLILSLHGVHASAALAEMRANFVSAVTHELKTPIANMRAITETLGAGRGDPGMIREYAKMGSREAARLTRLIDNLLAYARITDVADAYTMAPVAIESVVDRSLQEFASHLTDGGFDVHVDLPEELPTVRGDATALGMMLNNLVDNAIRYSDGSRHLTVSAHQAGARVVLSVTDKGIGIPGDELARVTGRFFRGRRAARGGSGLGLAIVARIVEDHRGQLEITSVAGVGTKVSVSLPVLAS